MPTTKTDKHNSDMDNELFGELHEQEEYELYGKRHERESLGLSNDVEQSEQLCRNLDKNLNCKNMCLTHCIDGNKFWK